LAAEETWLRQQGNDQAMRGAAQAAADQAGN
jgi:hypothetical protein